MDEFAVSKIDTDVRDRDAAFFVGQEEEQVTFLQMVKIDRHTFFGLCPGGAGQVDTVFFEKILYISGTVKAFRCGAAPDILAAFEIFGIAPSRSAEVRR